MSKFPQIHMVLSFIMSRLCGTLSKAVEKSRYKKGQTVQKLIDFVLEEDPLKNGSFFRNPFKFTCIFLTFSYIKLWRNTEDWLFSFSIFALFPFLKICTTFASCKKTRIFPFMIIGWKVNFSDFASLLFIKIKFRTVWSGHLGSFDFWVLLESCALQFSLYLAPAKLFKIASIAWFELKTLQKKLSSNSHLSTALVTSTFSKNIVLGICGFFKAARLFNFFCGISDCRKSRYLNLHDRYSS